MTFSDSSWRKSSYSGTETNCVQIAHRADTPVIGIRDSKNPDAGHLTVGQAALHHLLATAAS